LRFEKTSIIQLQRTQFTDQYHAKKRKFVCGGGYALCRGRKKKKIEKKKTNDSAARNDVGRERGKKRLERGQPPEKRGRKRI